MLSSLLSIPAGADVWRTRLAGGGATHLSSHARPPRPATSDKTQGSQALVRPTASKRVSSPPVGTIPSTSDVTDDPNHNSKPQSCRYDRLLSACSWATIAKLTQRSLSAPWLLPASSAPSASA